MPKVMKPPTEYDDTDIDTGGQYYDGPPPKPGLYKGIVKKMIWRKVKGGEKDGEQRFMVLCEITEGKYKGAGVTKWLQLTKQGSPWFNQFLHSLTDGSEAQKKAVRKAFKEKGFALADQPDSNGGYAVTKLGGKVNPIGLECMFFTKMRNDNENRAEISRFVVKTAPEDDESSDDTDSLDGVDDSSEPDPDSFPDVPQDDSSDSAEDSEEGTGDDPWTV